MVQKKMPLAILMLCSLLFFSACGNLKFISGIEKKAPNPPASKPDPDGDEDRDALATPQDSDGDGLVNDLEESIGTSPDMADSDGDGLDDGEEYRGPTDPREFDSDGDGIGDGQEVLIATDPLNFDTDGDGLGDGLEYHTVGTDPRLYDTDGGGVSDRDEVQNSTNPYSDSLDDLFTGLHPDTDGDGVDDCDEVTLGTDKELADSDGDGLSDGVERFLKTSPIRADTDGAGVSDFLEASRGSSPLSATGESAPHACFPRAKIEILGDTPEFVEPFVSPFAPEQSYLSRGVGPGPQNNVFYIYLYRSINGVFLVVHANADHLEDNRIEEIRFLLSLSSSYQRPVLEYADVPSQVSSLIEGRFQFSWRHWRSVEGAVIGPLGENFEAQLNLLSSSDTDLFIFASGNGSEHILKRGLIDETTSFRFRSTSCLKD